MEIAQRYYNSPFLGLQKSPQKSKLLLECFFCSTENKKPTANSQKPEASSQQPTASSQHPNSQKPEANSQQPTPKPLRMQTFPRTKNILRSHTHSRSPPPAAFLQSLTFPTPKIPTPLHTFASHHEGPVNL
jgi:hypothetical protein